MQFRTHRPAGGLPYTVAISTGARQPLPGVLFLHGRGERGADGTAHTAVGVGPALEAAEWPAIVVMPQCPDGEGWTGAILAQAMAALDQAVADYPITGDVALTGISMGGLGAWEAAARWPERFTRVMPICAAARPESVPALAGMPIWIHHGARDDIVPVDGSRRMMKLLAGSTEHLRYDEYPDAAHEIWDGVYGHPGVADWLTGGELATETPSIRPVFIGGTGRSGTSTMATLIARHPDFVAMPEVRLHTRAGGLMDVLKGESTPEEFAGRARRGWYYRWKPGEAPVGVHRLIDDGPWFRLIDRYVQRFSTQPEEASRMVLRGILDPLAIGAGAAGWVEHSPINVRKADVLVRLFPDMKMVHCVRDGRDTARSMTRQTWGPDSTEDALGMWAARMWEAHEATRDLPAERILVVRWEEMVDRDREGQYQRVLDFLGIEDVPQMRLVFDKSVHADGAHIARWRKELPATEADRIDGLYREHLQEMAEAGVTCLPIPPD